jgi:hypothetical protein
MFDGVSEDFWDGSEQNRINEARFLSPACFVGLPGARISPKQSKKWSDRKMVPYRTQQESSEGREHGSQSPACLTLKRHR